MYLRRSVVQELQALGRKGPANTPNIFQVYNRFAQQVQPGMMEMSACVRALIESKAGGNAIDAADLLSVLGQLEDVVKHTSDHRDLVQFSWMLARLCRLRPSLPRSVLTRIPQKFEIVEARARPLLSRFDLRDMSLMAWAFAKSSTGSNEMFHDIGQAALGRLDQLDGRHVSNLLWAFATIRVEHELFSWIAGQLAAGGGNLQDFQQLDISNTIWAYATVQCQHPEFFSLVASVVNNRMHEFEAQGLATTCWSFASLKTQASFIPCIIEHLEANRLWAKLEPRQCAMLVWSFATLRHYGQVEAFCLLFADRCVLHQIDSFHGQDVSSFLWAMSTTRVEHTEISDALTRRASEIAHSLPAQAMSNIIWAAAKLQVRSPDLLDAFTTEATKRQFRSWPPVSITTFCWALAEMGHDHTELLSFVGTELQTRIRHFNDIDLATVVRLLRSPDLPANVILQHRRLLADIEEEAGRRHLPRTSETLLPQDTVASASCARSRDSLV